MAQLLAQLVPLGLAAAVSPSLLAITIVVLSSNNRPRLRTFAYLLGSVLTLLVIGFIAVSAGGAAKDTGHGPSPVSATIDVILGLLLLYVGIRRALGGKSGGDTGRPAPEATSQSGALRDVGLGVVLTLTDFSSLVFYFAAAKQTADAHVAVADQIVAMSMMALFVMLPIILPLLIAIVAPARANVLLAKAHDAITRYGRYMVTVLSFAFGVYLIWKGVGRL